MEQRGGLGPPGHPDSSGKGLLWRPEHERDACGVGFVANANGSKSHRILTMALTCVANLTHRGAVAADAKSGDGAGVLTQIPYELYRSDLASRGVNLSNDGDLAVGMMFLPGRDAAAADQCRQMLERAAARHGVQFLGWRPVPVDSSALGEHAIATQPQIEQALFGRSAGQTDEAFSRALYLVRKEVEAGALERGILDLYICSLSNRTIIYKGLMVAPQLAEFYGDLRNPDFQTGLAVFHQRYSTNTFPSWELAQPFRFLAHNGEINTLQGNKNWTVARESELQSENWGEQVELLRPLIQSGGSDSAMLDNVLESVIISGRDVRHAMMMLIPEAWENMPQMDQKLRAFYEYHACITEPWDGPASLAFSDGQVVGATLDRNGLRPARYTITDDGLIVMGSEVGCLEIEPEKIVKNGRLGPGQMVAVDTVRGVIQENREVKDDFANRKPYGQWLKRQLLHLDDHLVEVAAPAGPKMSHNDLVRRQVAAGWTHEEIEFIIKSMVIDGKEATWSMGDDTPLSEFASTRRLLYSYFKQKFAQVTNPPIDPLREELVMSLDTYLGRRRSLFEETERHSKVIHLASPLMIDEELTAIRHMDDPEFASLTLNTVFPVVDGFDGLEPALNQLCEVAERAIDDGVSVLILSDRAVTAEHAGIPMLLAVGAVHHHLIRAGKRMKASIVAETAEARDVHHIACLIGFGASAVNPYLAFETIGDLHEEGELKGVDLNRAIANYEVAIDAGLLKIISKMGISTITGYHGAQIFEALGLNQELLDRCFSGMSSRIGGIGLEGIAEDTLERHYDAYSESVKMLDGGYYRYRRDGDYHSANPQLVKALHKAVATEGNVEGYREYARMVTERPPTALRDLLRFKGGNSIPLDDVEPATEIVKRFVTAAMSLGALSPEAHETVTVAVNRIGARSNTGEGGEESNRFPQHRRLNGSDESIGEKNSRIKQVASARFGVTPSYLVAAEELEIKMAQGSKPGEGGQLPAQKVSSYIAALRHTLPGTPLISPPPHHDIYSIEDLAQLIYDLKMVNPRARVAVKLVAEEGVGTIAAGVAKGYADTIHIAGHDGGTGASPSSSIKNAGSPWELGLAETQQVLVRNHLRGRVVIQADGGLKNGRDVVIAAMLGADEFGFGTGVLIAIGCQMARQCHLNTCPVGIATQREDLRAKFTGTPEHAIRFFFHIAEEVREHLAMLGYRTLDEIIGHTELLVPIVNPDYPRTSMVDLSQILADPDPTGEMPRRCMQARNDRPDEPLDDIMLNDAVSALDGKSPAKLAYRVRNVNRTVGARLAGEVAWRFGEGGLPEGTIEVNFDGSAGQSFGAFCHRGVRLNLEGEANDYVAKGMGGGEVIVRPSAKAKFASHENVIIGNTCLYGATGGSLFVSGRAGERFAVRNSGARAVVEGVGDHGCEYMTEGVVVILGETGRNFGAGMSNGVAYVFDERGDFPSKLNPELVGLQRIQRSEDEEILRALIERHKDLTGSARSASILARWSECLPLFWKVAPHYALTEEGPMTVVQRHLESLRAAVA